MNDAANAPMSVNEMLEHARKTVPEVGAAQAKARLDAGDVDLILDVREPYEWDKGHIPGAVLAPRGLLEWYADPTSPYAKPEITERRDARIIVHCAAGARSLLAAETLKRMGYTDVTSMAGGFNEWSQQGFPVE